MPNRQPHPFRRFAAVLPVQKRRGHEGRAVCSFFGLTPPSANGGSGLEKQLSSIARAAVRLLRASRPALRCSAAPCARRSTIAGTPPPAAGPRAAPQTPPRPRQTPCRTPAPNPPRGPRRTPPGTRPHRRPPKAARTWPPPRRGCAGTQE